MPQPLSITIVTRDEENNIGRCLKSVQWADEIVVIDSGSADRTVEICRQFTNKIIETEWRGFGQTKKIAVNAATHDWILSIDSDEEVSEELKLAIQKILHNPDYHAYRVKRITFYLGKQVRHCGWGNEYQLKFFNRKFGNFNDKIVHESVQITGEVGKIEAPIYHYSYPTIQSHIQKMDNYSELGADQLSKQGKSASFGGTLLRGLAKFIKMYFFQKGFLDGKIGVIISYNSAFGVYLKYLKLWSIRKIGK